MKIKVLDESRSSAYYDELIAAKADELDPLSVDDDNSDERWEKNHNSVKKVLTDVMKSIPRSLNPDLEDYSNLGIAANYDDGKTNLVFEINCTNIDDGGYPDFVAEYEVKFTLDEYNGVGCANSSYWIKGNKIIPKFNNSNYITNVNDLKKTVRFLFSKAGAKEVNKILRADSTKIVRNWKSNSEYSDINYA